MQDAGCRVQGAGCRVQGAGCRVQGAGYRVQGTGYRVQGTGYRVQGTGHRVDVNLLHSRARGTSKLAEGFLFLVGAPVFFHLPFSIWGVSNWTLSTTL